MIVCVAAPILTIGVMAVGSRRNKRRAQGKGRRQPAENAQAVPKTGKAGEGQSHSLAEESLNRLLNELESLRLSDYLRHVEDRRKLFWTSFLSGIARGLGSAIGFTILGAILISVLQDLARHNLPLIGKLLDDIIAVVENSMK